MPLSYLHLNYETCEQYPDIEIEPRSRSLFWEEKPEHFLIGTRAMRFADKERKKHSSSTNTSKSPASPQKHIAMSSTVERHWSGYRPLQNHTRPKQRHCQRPQRLVRQPRDLITKLKLELQRQEHQSPPDNEEKSMYIACYILSLSGKTICADIKYSVYNS